MSFTLTTSSAIVMKAGSNVNSTAAASSAILQTFCDMAEGRIVAETRRNWVTNYSSLSTDIKNVLSDVASDIAGSKLINYDMSGFTSRLEAQTMLDFMRDNIIQNMQVLKDFKSDEIKSPR